MRTTAAAGDRWAATGTARERPGRRHGDRVGVPDGDQRGQQPDHEQQRDRAERDDQRRAHVVSFSPMHHWTDHNIRVHVFTCVLALQIAHLMRRHAAQAGLALSVRELLDQLAAIQETVLIYPSTGGRPKARRMLTETTTTQDQLTEIFNLNHWAPHT